MAGDIVCVGPIRCAMLLLSDPALGVVGHLSHDRPEGIELGERLTLRVVSELDRIPSLIVRLNHVPRGVVKHALGPVKWVSNARRPASGVVSRGRRGRYSAVYLLAHQRITQVVVCVD